MGPYPAAIPGAYVPAAVTLTRQQPDSLTGENSLAVIDSAETSLLHPRLKFMLGELLLGSWRPQLLVADPMRFGLAEWPDAPSLMRAALPAGADGFLCRKVDASRFEPGIGVYGDFIRYVRYRDVLHYVEIAGSFDDYLKRFSAKSRQNLTRSVRRFLERDPQRNGCEIYTAAADMQYFQREAAAISQQTYQTRLLDAGLPADAEFLQGMLAAAERGEARGYLLRDGDRAIAFAWCRSHGDNLVYDIIGYLPDSASLSPGNVLLYLILQDVFSNGHYAILDFGPGEAQYKSMFATHRQEFQDVYLLRDSLQHRLLLRLHYRLGTISADVGALLERYGLKKRIKQLIRSLRS